MATLTEIAAAQLEAQSRRLAGLTREVSRRVGSDLPPDADDSQPEHQVAARIIDQLAKDVDAAIDRFNSGLVMAAAGKEATKP